MIDPDDSTIATAPRAAAAALLLGFFSQFSQIIAFREVLAVCRGTEVLFGIVLAGSLAWTALGTLIGSAVGRMLIHRGERRWLAALLAGLASINGICLASEIFIARGLAGWGAEMVGQAPAMWRSAALAGLACGPAALMCGAQFGLTLKLASPADFSRLYRAESWGSVVAGLLFTFLLVHFMPPVRGALAAGALVAVGMFLAMRRIGGGGLWRAAMLLVVAAYAVLARLPLEDAGRRWCWQGLMAGYELVEQRDTPYGRLAALQKPGSRQISIYQDAALIASLEPDAPVSVARQWADVCATLHPRPGRALIVGGGLGRFPEELLRHGLDAIDVVELDPALFEMAARYGQPSADPRIHRIRADGRAFIKHADRAAYDLIVVSAGEPDNSTVNRYYTVEFFRECRACLRPAGVLVINASTYGAGVEYLGRTLTQRTATIWRTLLDAFEHVRGLPVNGVTFVASAAAISLDPADLASRIGDRPAAKTQIPVTDDAGVRWVAIPPADYFSAVYDSALAVTRDLDGNAKQDKVEALESALRAAGGDVNRDEHPVLMTQSLVLGSELSGPENHEREAADTLSLGMVLQSWGNGLVIVPLGLAGVACVIAIIGRLIRRDGGGSWAAMLAAVVTGFYTMALQVTLLAAYQNVRGYVYQEIGVIIASFMIGLAVGARIGTRWLARPAAMAVVGMALMAGQVLLLPGAVNALAGMRGSAGAAAGFWLMIFVAGLLDGMVLPALARMSLAGGIYSLDLAGAALGALLCGGVWLPLLGMNGATYAVAAMVGAGVVAVCAHLRGRRSAA